MSDYLEENPHKVKNAAYYRRQMKELERENAELKRIIDDMELLGYAHQCDDYDGSVISTDEDEYGDKTVAIYKVKDTK